jgi:hypothetical protein
MQQEVTRMGWRRTLSIVSAGLVLCLGLGSISAGCASSKGQKPVPVAEATPDDPVPESTLSYLNDCAESWADDLEERSYRIEFDLTITKHGDVRQVNPVGSRLDARDMEKCMIGALRMMFVPGFVVERASSELGSQRMPAHARGFIGQTEAMEEVLFKLAPIIIRAGPVTIIVVIGIVAAAAVVDAVDEEMEERCEEQRRDARRRCEELLKLKKPSRKMTGGHSDLENCMQGFIDEDCGGNAVDHGGRGARPGRKW